eukprot:15483296-Alexandrium_andersonii.AAC.1
MPNPPTKRAGGRAGGSPRGGPGAEPTGEPYDYSTYRPRRVRLVLGSTRPPRADHQNAFSQPGGPLQAVSGAFRCFPSLFCVFQRVDAGRHA